MVLLHRARKNARMLYYLPLLFLIWANLHGTFVIGVGIMAVYLGYYFFLYPANRRVYLVIGIITLVATFFNPFGLRVYYEVLKHMRSPYLQDITEWNPIYRDCGSCHVPTVGVYVALLLLAAVWKTDIIYNLPLLIIFLVLVIPAVTQRRNMSVFVIATLPLLLGYLEKVRSVIDRSKSINWILLVLACITIEYTVFTRLPGFHFYRYTEADYCQFGSGCSLGLTDYLITHPPVGRGFNTYDWGGYFIGKDIKARLFIDGRMHLWEVSDGYMPFADYVAMYFKGDIKLFNSYDFDWVAVAADSTMATAMKNELVSGSWKIEFQDDRSVYFVRVR
jgi:hypothetical protein